MHWLYRWLLRYVARRIVVQGPSHKRNIEEYYAIMTEAARNEFSEDNVPTLDLLLTECHRESLRGDWVLISPKHEWKRTTS